MKNGHAQKHYIIKYNIEFRLYRIYMYIHCTIISLIE